MLSIWGIDQSIMANALTAVRLLLVAPFVFWMAKGDQRSAIVPGRGAVG